MAFPVGAAIWFRASLVRGAAVCAAGLRVADPPPLEELRVRTFDLFQVIQPRVCDRSGRSSSSTSTRRASRQLGQWPWPRTRVADLITRLTELGAAAIGFDVVFAEPDRLSPNLAADAFRNLDEETRKKLRALPSNDQVLADAMRHSRVVLGETGLPFAAAANRSAAAADGACDLGRRSGAVSSQLPGAAAEHSGS